MYVTNCPVPAPCRFHCTAHIFLLARFIFTSCAIPAQMLPCKRWKSYSKDVWLFIGSPSSLPVHCMQCCILYLCYAVCCILNAMLYAECYAVCWMLCCILNAVWWIQCCLLFAAWALGSSLDLMMCQQTWDCLTASLRWIIEFTRSVFHSLSEAADCTVVVCLFNYHTVQTKQANQKE